MHHWRKTVLESKIDSVGKKLESVKVNSPEFSGEKRTQRVFLSHQLKCIGFWSDVLAFGQAYWLMSYAIAANRTWRHENETENTLRVFPEDASNSITLACTLTGTQTCKPGRNANSAAPAEMYRLFFEGLSRDDTHFHQLAQKYKK